MYFRTKCLTMKLAMLLWFLLVFSTCSFSQNTIGLPDIINYHADEYNAGTQNWDIAEDTNEFIYFANNDGLLRFDGTSWKLYQLPNKTIVRSVAIGKDGRIYVGSQNEMGFFSPDQNGKLVYTSLKNLLSPADYTFA